MKNKKYLDKLFIRIFLSSIVLLVMVVFNKYNFLNFNNYVVRHLNFSVLTKQINTLIDNTEEVSGEITFEEVSYRNDLNYFVSTFNGVTNLEDGVVIKIEKNNNLYNITILTSDDYEYTYKELDKADCYLYEYVTKGKIIGSVSIDKNNQYLVSIYKDGQYYEYK